MSHGIRKGANRFVEAARGRAALAEIRFSFAAAEPHEIDHVEESGFMREVLGIIIALFGGLSTLNCLFWAGSGNHGATWGQMLPYLVVSAGLTLFGVYLFGGIGNDEPEDSNNKHP